MLLSVVLAAFQSAGLVSEQGVLVIGGEFAVGQYLGGSGGSACNAPSSGQFTISSVSWAGFVSRPKGPLQPCAVCAAGSAARCESPGSTHAFEPRH